MTAAVRDSLDYATAAVVLVIAVLVTGAAAAVVKFYAGVLRRAPRPHGLLLWHVVAIAAGTAGTWLTIAFGQLSILGLVDSPRPLRLVGYAVFGLLTFVAITIVGRMQRRRVQALPERTVVLRERGAQVDDETIPEDPPGPP